jgi:hypothetical protein
MIVEPDGREHPAVLCPAEDWITFTPDLSALDRSDPTLAIDFELHFSRDGGATWKRTYGCRFVGGIGMDEDDLTPRTHEFAITFPRVIGGVARNGMMVPVDLAGCLLRTTIRPSRTVQCGMVMESANLGRRLNTEPTPIHRSIGILQFKAGVNGLSVTNVSTAFDSNVTAGSAILAITHQRKNAAGVPATCTLSDTQSNSYTSAGTPPGVGRSKNQADYDASAAAGATTVTSTNASDTLSVMALHLYEITGHDSSSFVGAYNSSSATTGTAVTSGAIDPPGNALYIFSGTGQLASQTFTIGADIDAAVRHEFEGGSGLIQIVADETGTGESKTGNATMSASGNWTGLALAVNEAAAGGVVVPALDEGMLVGGMQPLSGGID